MISSYFLIILLKEISSQDKIIIMVIEERLVTSNLNINNFFILFVTKMPSNDTFINILKLKYLLPYLV